ncbi:MAG: MFS transporter [archaeon]
MSTTHQSRSSKPVIAACVVQFVVAYSVNFTSSFLTLFINKELAFGNLSEATLWAGVTQLVTSSATAFTQPFWGWLVDKTGGKKMLLRILIVYTFTIGLISISTNVYQVLALRLIQGILGGTSTVVMAIIASSVEGEDLTRAIGYQQSVQTAGFLVGPALGAAMAMAFGFRTCFLIAGLVMAAAIPFVLWAKFEDKKDTKSSSEKISFGSFKAIAPDFVSLISIQAAYQFIAPIVPLYLTEAGFGSDSLIGYTGLVLALSTLAYAASIPFTTRLFKRKHLPILLTISSAAILFQGFFREIVGFTALRMTQCFFLSAGPSLLLGGAGSRKANKGFAIGILNSGRFLGNALGPFIASSVAFAANLTLSLTAMALFSSIAIFVTIASILHKRTPTKT